MAANGVRLQTLEESLNALNTNNLLLTNTNTCKICKKRYHIIIMPRSGGGAAQREAARHELVTQNFFGHPSPHTCSGTCTHEMGIQALAHATSSAVRRESAKMKKQLENLTAEEKQRFEAYTASGGPIHTGDHEFDGVVDTLAAVTIAKDHPKYRSEAFKKVDTFDLTKVEEVEKVDEQYENALADSEKKGQEVREWITEHSKTGPEKLLLTDTMKELDQPTLDKMMSDKAFASTMATANKIILDVEAMNASLVYDAIRPLQLFNAEKRWGFVDETFQKINCAMDQHSEDPEPATTPLSFRQMLNDPESLYSQMLRAQKYAETMSTKMESKGQGKEDKSEETKSKGKGKAKQSQGSNSKGKGKEKKDSPEETKSIGKGKEKESQEQAEDQSHLTMPIEELIAKANDSFEKAKAAMELFQTNVKGGIEMIREHNASVGEIDEGENAAMELFQTSLNKDNKVVEEHNVSVSEMVEKHDALINTPGTNLPHLPKRFTYHDVVVKKEVGLPLQVREDVFKLLYIEKWIEGYGIKVNGLRDRAYDTIKHWFCAGKGCWDYAKEHMHEMALMREYEHERTYMAALFLMENRTKRKLVSWFFKNGSPNRGCALAKAIYPSIEQCGFWDIKADLQAKEDEQTGEYKSVDEMVKEFEKRDEKEGGALASKPHWSHFVLGMTTDK